MVQLRDTDDAEICSQEQQETTITTSASKFADKSVDATTDIKQEVEAEENIKQCVESLEAKLACVDDETVKACSISVVPEKLRKLNVEAYRPQVVSMGPLHRGKGKGITCRTDLLYMEEIKLRCVKYLFRRTKAEENLNLRACIEAMLDIDELVRASYADDIDLNRYELAKIMVLDGCFLLELLISGTVLNDKIINRVREDPTNTDSHDRPAGVTPETTSPGVEVMKMEKVLLDLMMLENQIPTVVLVVLSAVLFRNNVERKDDTHEKKEVNDDIILIHKHALSILGYSDNSLSEFEGYNLLELIHSFVYRKREDKNTVEDNEGYWDLENSKKPGEEVKANRRTKLRRCATRLEASGVTIKPSEAKSKASNVAEQTKFDLKVTFIGGILEIPQLYITETTEAKWRNLIAWELNRTTLEKESGKREDRISCCQFISYARFIQSLICSVHDVQLLLDREVIRVQKVEESGRKIMSNKKLMKLFRNITKEVPVAEIDMDLQFAQVIEKLNKYPTPAGDKIVTNGVVGTGKIMWHILRCFITWILCQLGRACLGLRRVYFPSGWTLIAIFAAALGLGCTIVQTVFAVLSHSRQ